MHSTQLTIIVIGMLLGFFAIAYYIRKAVFRALERSYLRGLKIGRTSQLWKLEALDLDLHQAQADRQAEKTRLESVISEYQVRLAPPVTQADHQLLLEIAITLDLAQKTWQPMKGSQPVQVRTTAQIQKLGHLSDRILQMVEVVPIEAKRVEDAA